MVEFEILKDVDVEEFNAEYAKKTTPLIASLELIKDLVEHRSPNAEAIIEDGFDTDGEYIRFFNKTDEAKTMTLEIAKNHFKTFYKSEHANNAKYDANLHNHHGLCFLQIWKIKFHCGKVQIDTINMPDKPNYYFWIGNKTDQAEYIDGWEIKVYSKEIIETIGDTLKRLVVHEYIDPKIIYNGDKFEFEKKTIEISPSQSIYYHDEHYNGKNLYNTLRLSENEDTTIQAYWKLSIDGYWIKVDMPYTNKMHVCGDIYLTDNSQMANEARLELTKRVQQVINDQIDSIREKFKAKIECQEKVNNFDKYASEFSKFMNEAYSVPALLTHKVFFSNSESKQDQLIMTARFYETIWDITDGKIKDKIEYEPFASAGIRIDKLGETTFKEKVAELGLKLDYFIENSAVGFIICEGERSKTLYIKDLLRYRSALSVSDGSYDEDDYIDGKYIEQILFLTNRELFELVIPDEKYKIVMPSDLTSRSSIKKDTEYYFMRNLGYDFETQEFITSRKDASDFSPELFLKYTEPRSEPYDFEFNGIKYYANIVNANYKTKKQDVDYKLYYITTNKDELKKTIKLDPSVYHSFVYAIGLALEMLDIKMTCYPMIMNDPSEPDILFIPTDNAFILNIARKITFSRKSSEINTLLMKICELIASTESSNINAAYFYRFKHAYECLNKKFKRQIKNNDMITEEKEIYLVDELKDYF